jgi:murein L,D-transpeptidase YcbB/YkuD
MKKLFALIVFACFVAAGFAQQSAPKVNTVEKADSILQKFYAINSDPLYWFSSRKDMKRAVEWLTVIKSAKSFGLVSDVSLINELLAELQRRSHKDKIRTEKTDKKITSLVLKFIKELQEGIVTFEYDEVSAPRDSEYIYQLRNSRYKGSVANVVSRLDCRDSDYLIYKKYLNDSLTADNVLKYKTIVLAMNYRRYLTLNGQSEYVLANIPETEVEYIRNGESVLKMRSVAGKKKNPTPTIASYITNIVSFPFWNVPFSIASKELLPKVQKDESYLERNNFEVVDAKGNLVDDSDLNWAGYTEKTFPYFFRESTGPNNSLGVLKFNLGNPFSIYLHDTNSKGAFSKDYRFLSHGCIRLEKPVELAKLLADDKIDPAALKSGKKDTESEIIKLDKKIPVFIIYMPVKLVGQKVVFLPDEYGLIN